MTGPYFEFILTLFGMITSYSHENGSHSPKADRQSDQRPPKGTKHQDRDIRFGDNSVREAEQQPKEQAAYPGRKWKDGCANDHANGKAVYKSPEHGSSFVLKFEWDHEASCNEAED